ncbi:MAG: hypothetical protein JST91_29735 [Actinobacteria bacterium]|nr:hypothetical protein [Actinomycetota bacterium]
MSYVMLAILADNLGDHRLAPLVRRVVELGEDVLDREATEQALADLSALVDIGEL